MNNLIINGIDHSKFDLEWAKRGGVVLIIHDDSQLKILANLAKYVGEWAYFINTTRYAISDCEVYFTCGLSGSSDLETSSDTHYVERMATPSECAEAGIEYIEPLARWLPIETMQADIDSLEAQLAEARKDSERFEWMVSYDGEVRNLSCTGNSYCYAVYSEKNGDLNYEYSIYGKTPREAIDNAMKGGER